MNRFEITGRLVRESETRFTKEGMQITTFTLGIRNGKDDSTYLKITTFGNTAKAIENYTHKGDLILIEGMVKNNNYEDKDGNKHYEYVFIGNRVEFLSGSSKQPAKEETAQKPVENGLDDQAFIDFGKKIESEVAF